MGNTRKVLLTASPNYLVRSGRKNRSCKIFLAKMFAGSGKNKLV